MRIYPLYLATIVAAVFLMKITGVYNADGLIANLPRLLTFISYPQLGFAIGVFWTLQIEFWFYVVFPFVFAFLSSWSVAVRDWHSDLHQLDREIRHRNA
jgi:peptidoglycan/LPS O-acetylase OafA/YrhL